MVRKPVQIFVAIVWIAMATAASAQVLTPQRAIRDQYIVVLNEQHVASAQVRNVVAALARARGGRVQRIYEHALRGFSVTMSATAAAALARDPRVRYIEQDSVMTIVDTQVNATWGLDRIDQRDRPLSGTYTFNTVAANVHVYVIDTGIRSSHFEFGGRVSSTGYTAISDGNGTS